MRIDIFFIFSTKPSSASKQHRACHILAFSGGGNIKDFEIPLGLGRKEGFIKLLSFLGDSITHSHTDSLTHSITLRLSFSKHVGGSFKGGTDICSPLIRGSELVGDNIEWAGADLLMVTGNLLLHFLLLLLLIMCYRLTFSSKTYVPVLHKYLAKKILI